MAGSSAAILGVNSSIMNSSAPAAPSEKKKRNQPGTPSPDAEVVALSPKTLMATNRFICEVCNKGFQREQNLQLHRRGHNLPWKLKQKASRGDVTSRKKVYLCPEPGCLHHDPARALGDLTGIKKHFSRKHCEKRFTCEKCNKKYAVHSDCKAHSKQCGSKAYKCDCGTTFSRRDSFVSHRAYCEALAQDTARHSLSSIAAATMYANASSAAIPTLGSTAPLMSADHQEPVSHPVFELGAPAAASRPSFTDLLSGHSVGSSLIRPVDQQMIVQPPEPKLSYQFSELQGINHNSTAPTGPMFSWDSPVQNYEDDLKMNNIGFFTGLMMDDIDAPVYDTTPQLSATALLKKAAFMGSNTSSADLMKSLGSSSSGVRKFNNYGGVFGNGIGAGVGAGTGGTYHNMYSTTNTDATGGSCGNGGYGVGMGLSEMNHNPFGGVTYNYTKNNDGMKLNYLENDYIGLEPQMSAQSGHRDKLTRDFLGVGKMRSFSGGMEDDQKGNGTELKAPDSEATTSAKPSKLPFVRYRPDV